MKITIREQTCHLLAEKAVFWEEKKILIVADIHIGKATVFRKQGIAIPEGNMQQDLIHLKELIQTTGAEKCIVAGDLIHAKSGLSDSVKLLFSKWLHEVKCEIHLVLGNHDYSLAKTLPKEWTLYLHTESLLIEPFYFSHFPMHHHQWFVWSGHLHPKIEIKNRHDRLVLRCFQIFSDLGILPAFGSFVGGAFVKKCESCQIFAIVNANVIRI